MATLKNRAICISRSVNDRYSIQCLEGETIIDLGRSCSKLVKKTLGPKSSILTTYIGPDPEIYEDARGYSGKVVSRDIAKEFDERLRGNN